MAFLGPGFGTLLILAALCHFNRVAMAVAGSERIMEQYALSPSAMGGVYSVFLLTYTIAMVPGGWFIDRHGPRVALAVAGFGSAALVSLTAVAALASSADSMLAALIAIRAAAGIVTAPFHPAAARAVALGLTGPARSFANGAINGAAVVGIASTYFVFGYLIDVVSWPAAFVITGVAIALGSAAWLASARPPAAASPAAGLAPAEREPSLLHRRDLVLLTISYAGLGYFRYLFFYWIQYYFRTVLGQSEEASRLFATIPTLALAAGMFGGGWLADRLQQRCGRRVGLVVVPAGGLALGAVLLVAGAAQAGAVWAVVSFSFALAAAGLCEGPFWTAATALGGRRGGSAGAILNTGGNLGGLLAPEVTPLISARLGWPASLAVAALLSLLAAVLWRWIDPYRGGDALERPA